MQSVLLPLGNSSYGPPGKDIPGLGLELGGEIPAKFGGVEGLPVITGVELDGGTLALGLSISPGLGDVAMGSTEDVELELPGWLDGDAAPDWPFRLVPDLSCGVAAG